MKTILKPEIQSVITIYISHENKNGFMNFLRMIEELDMGRALTEDDRRLKSEVSAHFGPGSQLAQVTMSIMTFNTLYNNRK